MTPDDIPISETRAPWIPRPPLLSVFGDGKAKKAWFKWYIQSGLLVPVQLLMLGILWLTPLTLVDRFGCLLGRLIGAQQRKSRKFARELPDRIAAINPALSSAENREAAARTWFEQQGVTHIRFGLMDRYTEGDRMRLHGVENAWPLRERDQRFIVACVHLGDWESMGNFSVASPGAHSPIGLYEPQKTNFENWMVSRKREAKNLYVFPPGMKSARHVAALMKARKTDINIFVDEVVDGQSRFPFFGRKPYKHGNLSRLAHMSKKYRMPVVPVYMLRGERPGVDIHVLPAIMPESLPEDDYEAAIKERVNAVYEPVIRDNITQWYMLKDTPLK
ncbi:lysophospholipid acyltransferase family protein [Coralliovum pocilloporae]|uniref:lysophospholipid acyltransferase family protein n=1 Tax=Coralliovum pocilloporae TaxID=3066369 RepID=UPI0033072916